MNRKTIIATSTAVLITVSAMAVGASALAKQKQRGHGEYMIKKITKTLALNEGQVDALNALHTEVHETRALVMPDRAALISELTNMINDDSFDQQRALDLWNERLSVLQSNAPDVINAAAVFFDGLSTEQKAEITEKMQRLEKHRGRGHGGH